MKYERLTNRGEPFYGFEKCKTCEYGKDGCDKWCDQTTGCFCRLQELEDKIETGELCDREEVRKKTAKEILEAVFQIMVENFFDSAGKQTYVTAKKILRDICPVKVKNACKNVAEKYGIELFGKNRTSRKFRQVGGRRMTEQETIGKIVDVLSNMQNFGERLKQISQTGPLKIAKIIVSNEKIADALIAAGLSFGNKHRIFVENAPIPKTCVDDTFFLMPNTPPTIKQLYGDEEVEKIVKERDEYKHRAEVWKQATKDMINTDICFGCHARATGICFKQNQNPETDECMNAIYKQAEKELQEERK